MANKVVLLSSRQLTRWDEFVRSHPWGSIYHTSAWREVIQTTYSLEPFYFALVDDKENILAGLPIFEIKSWPGRKKMSTLPCAQSCDPLVSNEEQYLKLKDCITQFSRERGFNAWELKISDLFPYELAAEQTNMYFTYILELDKESFALFVNFHKMLQRAIKKASRFGLSLKQCYSLEQVQRFYDLYLAMRRQKGLLPQPRAFFENLWMVLRPEKRIDILFAEYRGTLISTVMLLKHGDRITYEYGATQRGANRYSPSPFLLWEAIKQAQLEGFIYFDFGRTAPS